MRVAITLLVALAAAVSGPMPAFAGCSSGGGGGSSPITTLPKAILNPILPVLGLPPLGGTTTNITNITNNTTNITNVTAAEQTGQPTQTALALGPGTGGAGAGGGGGFGGMGGGFSGSSSGGGTPVNPSDTPSVQMMASGSSSSGSGGSGATFSNPTTMASLSSTTTDGPANVMMMAAADQSSEPLTPGVALASGPAPVSGADDAMTVAMASPKTERPATSDGFVFEGQAAPSTSHAPGTANTTMLAALIGVGMLGAGWAWRSLGV